MRSWGIKTEKDIYTDTQKMLQDYFVETKVRSNKKWENDSDIVNYNFEDSALKSGVGNSYDDVLKKLNLRRE